MPEDARRIRVERYFKFLLVQRGYDVQHANSLVLGYTYDFGSCYPR